MSVIFFVAVLISNTLASAEGFMAFSREPAFSDQRVIVTIGVLRTTEPGWNYWYRRDKAGRDRVSVTWTDTARCPPARQILENVSNLPLPQIAVPGIGNRPFFVRADGVVYRLRVSANWEGQFSDLDVSSADQTSLAEWADESLAVLEGCWSDQAPADE